MLHPPANPWEADSPPAFHEFVEVPKYRHGAPKKLPAVPIQRPMKATPGNSLLEQLLAAARDPQAALAQTKEKVE